MVVGFAFDRDFRESEDFKPFTFTVYCRYKKSTILLHIVFANC